MLNLTDIQFEISKNFSPLLKSELSANDKELIIENAVQLIGKEYKSIPMSLYRDYEITGNRKRYENAIEERNIDLASLIFAEYYEDKNRFLSSIIDLIYLICSEPAWWLPAHNLYIRDTKTEAYPDTTKPIICLHSAETSALLAITLLLLQNKLPHQCKAHVIKEIKERTLRPYENIKFWWMGGNGEHLNNWTPWCIQNILLCYLICEEDNIKIKEGVIKSLNSLTLFISQYKEDGGCEEGAEYYHHAALTFMGSIYVLNLLTDNAFDFVYKQTLIKNMLDYIRIVNVADNAYLNIGDCNQILEHSDLKPYFFATLTDNDLLKTFIANDWSKANEKEQLMLSSRYSFDRILSYNCITEARKSQAKQVTKQDGLIKFESTNLFIFNKAPFTFALNGSNNGVSHNHNDSGSFILYKNKEAIFIDVGVETYNSKTFSSERYTIWTMQDKFHNLTVFDEFSQQTGKEFGVKVLNYDERSITLSMLPAYIQNQFNKFYNREVSITGEGIKLIDSTNISTPHKLVLMSKIKPIRKPFGFSIGSAAIEIQQDFSVKEIKTEDKRLLISYPTGVLYKIEIPYKETIEVLIK